MRMKAHFRAQNPAMSDCSALTRLNVGRAGLDEGVFSAIGGCAFGAGEHQLTGTILNVSANGFPSSEIS